MSATERAHYVYRGLNRKGAGVTGTLPVGADIADFVQRQWRGRWSRLVVEWNGGPDDRRMVGAIQYSGTKRVWWAE